MSDAKYTPEYKRGYSAGYAAGSKARPARPDPPRIRPHREPSHADLTCALAQGDPELALTLWRVQNMWLARRCVALVDSPACRDFLRDARANELPLFNRLPEIPA